MISIYPIHGWIDGSRPVRAAGGLIQRRAFVTHRSPPHIHTHAWANAMPCMCVKGIFEEARPERRPIHRIVQTKAGVVLHPNDYSAVPPFPIHHTQRSYWRERYSALGYQ
jgi:hypothetical protein